MRKRQVQLIVVCEDDEHYSFACGYLKAKRYSLHRVRSRISPRGCARDYVKRQYVLEVRAARKYCRMNQSETYGLIILIDQDTNRQPNVYVDLDAELNNAGFAARSNSDPFAIFVPKRNVETWVYHLLDAGRSVDEEEDYCKHQYGIEHPSYGKAGQAFASYDPGANCPLPSLRKGCEERQRIPSP